MVLEKPSQLAVENDWPDAFEHRKWSPGPYRIVPSPNARCASCKSAAPTTPLDPWRTPFHAARWGESRGLSPPGGANELLRRLGGGNCHIRGFFQWLL